MASMVIDDLARFGPGTCVGMGRGEALAYVRGLAMGSRENFHVISRLAPRERVEDLCAVYAYCRWADDLGDEAGSPEKATALLAWWGEELRECFAGRARHPVFVALSEVIERRGLSIGPFEDLLSAFRQDQAVTRYETMEALLDYCRRSADPVGRLVLGVCGDGGQERERLSDATCTALQLVNFWQDVRRDVLERDRVYVPRERARRWGVEIGELCEVIRGTRAATKDFQEAYRSMVKELCAETAERFIAGRPLAGRVGPEVRGMVRLFTLGGQSVLRGIARAEYATWRVRPRVGKMTKIALLGRVWAEGRWGAMTARSK